MKHRMELGCDIAKSYQGHIGNDTAFLAAILERFPIRHVYKRSLNKYIGIRNKC